MKKLEKFEGSKFAAFKKNEIENLVNVIGGVESKTKDSHGTLKTLSGGCTQADVVKNDVSSDVGGVKCPPTKDSTSNGSAILTSGGSSVVFGF